MTDRSQDSESRPKPKWIDRWPVATLRLTGLMVGLSTLLFAIGSPLAEFGALHGYDDDWTMLSLPAGIIGGLYLWFRFRRRRWLCALSIVLTLLTLGFLVYLTIPITAPESVPAGMNRLPWGLAETVRRWLLQLMGIHIAVCLSISAAVNAILKRYFAQR